MVWITGLSGAGKTTVGERVVGAMRQRGRPVVWLDGDRLRTIMGAGDGFDAESRQRLAHTYARLSAEVASQGVDVVCTTVSMFRRVREWNRASVARYFEVYLRVPLDELLRRDPKGHYQRGDRMVGVEQLAEEPEAPDLLIDNHGDVDATTAASRIVAAIETNDARVLS